MWPNEKSNSSGKNIARHLTKLQDFVHSDRTVYNKRRGQQVTVSLTAVTDMYKGEMSALVAHSYVKRRSLSTVRKTT